MAVILFLADLLVKKNLRNEAVFPILFLDMLFANKKLINLKWLIPFFFFNLQFMAQANEIINEECAQEAKNHSEEKQSEFIEKCKTNKKQQIENLMIGSINCSNSLKEYYNIEESAVDNSSKNKDDENSPGNEEKLMIVKLKKDCGKEKQAATACCSNPNSCNGFAADLAQHLLPLTPALLSAYKSYKISDDANKGELTHEEAVNKMCNASNQVQLGVFGTSLLSQLAPMFQKTCGKQIAKCKESCNNHVTSFKQRFKKCYSKLFPNKSIQQIQQMVQWAQKKCFDIDLDTESFIDDFPIRDTNRKSNDVIKSALKCDFSLSRGFKEAKKREEKDEESYQSYQRVALSQLLYIAKAYKNTSKNKTSRLSDNSDEEEVIDCSHQPKRVLDSSHRPGGPISPPAISLCQQSMDHAVNNTPPPAMPGGGGANQPGNVSSTGSLTGNTRGANLAPLQVPAGEECQYGALDVESLENCPLPLGDEDFDVNKKPSLAKNIPSWEKGGGSGGSSGSGGGGIGSGGSGSLGGDTPSYGSGSMYPPYAGDMSAGSGFSDSGYNMISGGDGNSASPSREVSGNSDSDRKLDGVEMPFGEEGNPNEEKSIFQIASERIQNFCGDYSCD